MLTMNWNWNQKRVDEFMQHISTGFVPPSPLELALQLTALLTVVFAYIFIYRRIQAGRQSARIAYSESRFIEGCHESRLPPGDRRLLRRLAEYLPRPREELHTLLRDREVYQAAVDALLHTEYREHETPGAARPFAALGVRLGFKAQSSGRVVRSTADLPAQTVLYSADDAPLFRVLEVHPAHLDVEILTDLPPDWKRNRELELSFRRREGFYRITASLIAAETAVGLAGTRAVLSHNRGPVHRRQNRRHFRRALRLPVRFGEAHGYSINLSGGGALLEFSDGAKPSGGPGEVLDLTLELDARAIVQCTARVIALRGPQAQVQVEFVRIRDADRDRVIKLLFGEEGRSASRKNDDRSDSKPGSAAIACLGALLGPALYGLATLAGIAVPGGALLAQSPGAGEATPDRLGPRRIQVGGELGDYYYSRGRYDLARIEYDRRLRQLPHGSGETRSEPADNNGAALASSNSQPPGEESALVRAKLGLSLLRENHFRESLSYLNDRRDFRHLYLSMYASFRSGWAFQGLSAQSRILDRRDFTESQKDQARLLGGTVYLESGEHDRVRQYYTNLQKSADDETVRRMSGRVLTSLDGYESLDRKNAWLAAGFSTVLPGAGQIYAGHTVDGVTAFFFNGMFLGSAAIMYDLENRSGSPHIGSGIFGVIGLVFYLANVSGAYQTAHRYNAYQERRFHQEVRDAFFHLDYIEKNSGVVFQTDF
ncbi:MAG: PilZ domain-containing protein [Leptospirales bacterium]|jgi:TM2 domain-containing membrane protein YozV